MHLLTILSRHIKLGQSIAV